MKLKFPFLLLLITVAFNWKLLLSGQYTCLDGTDTVDQVIPWLQAQAVQWHGGHFPLWDPHLWAGEPLVGQVQPGTLNPLNWILFSMPFKDGFIQIPVLHWYWVSIQFLAVLFCYWLCRDLRLSQLASILGGCAFGLGGFVATIGWPQLMLSAVLLPPILMFLLRVLREENAMANAAAAGALLGASFLSGHHNVPTFFTLATIGLWIYIAAVRRKVIAPALAFAACFALIAAAQIVPAYELGHLSVRWAGAPEPLGWNQRVPYSVHETYSLLPAEILGIVIQGMQQDSAIFIGVVILTLGLTGAAASWKERSVRVSAAIGIGGLIFALGSRSLYHGVLYALIPNLDKARAPSMAEAIFHLGIVVLAAYGLDSLRTSIPAIRILGLSSLFLYASLTVLMTVRAEKSEEYKTLAQTALVALILSGILLLWKHSRLSGTAAGVLAILLLLFELNNVTNYAYRPFEKAANLRKLDDNRDLVAFLKQTKDFPRVEIDNKEIPYNFGDWFGVDQIGGFQPGLLKSLAKTQGEPRYRMLLAVNYAIARQPAKPDQAEVFQGASGLKIFTNPGALPRARIVHAAIGAPDENSILATVVNPATDLQRTVVVKGAPPVLENCDGGDVQIIRYRTTSVTMRANTPCKSMVVLADTWFPGWKAFVDGKPAQIYAAYDIVRGVVVDAGPHEIVMRYRPASVFTGMALALASILLCIALQFRRTRKETTEI
ncbi:MAG TPA: hypothetical protein VIX89_19430 [Bryobacteraceae bacterium]